MPGPLTRRTPQQRQQRRQLADGSVGILPATEPVEVYSTFECRIGRHPFCDEATAREPDPACPQVTYLPCGCSCHDHLRTA